MSQLEKTVTAIDAFRLWALKSWKLALFMVKGAYLLGERRKLFYRLGEEVYYKIQKREIQLAELDAMVSDLDKLTKKIEIEEMLIRTTRFGRPKRPKPPLTQTEMAEN